MNTSVWIAYYESRNFTFNAAGATMIEAIAALETGLVNHANKYGLAPDWYDREDIWSTEFEPGVCYRDGERI